MKRIYTYLIIGLLTAMGLGKTQAQVVDVCAGNDTVELRLGNFHYGYVQWQVSDDNEIWFDIDGAIDTVYRFLPERSRYYRAEVQFSRCSEYNYHSQVSFVQIPPKAYAGPDIDIPVNVPVRMCASTIDGAEGVWSIIEGAGGAFDDVNDPHAMFSGDEGEYKLVWTLTNSCGSSSDTISVSCVSMVYNDNILIVDETDIILSDTLQMLNGEYAIVFTDTVPDVFEGMVLLGYRERPFMRKVTSFEKVGDVFVMQTEQASVSDIIISGAMNFDLRDMEGIGSNRVMVLDRYPTRKELAANPNLLRDGGVYFIRGNGILDDNNGSKTLTVKFEDGKMIASYELNLKNVYPDLDGVFLKLEQEMDNFKFGIKLRNSDMAKFHMGFYNSHCKRTFKIYTDKHFAGLELPLKKGYFTKQMHLGTFVIGLVPFDVAFDTPYSLKMSASINGTLIERTTEWTSTHAIEWRNGGLVEVKKKSEPVKKSEPLNITGNFDVKLEAGARLSFYVGYLVGPSVELKGYFSPSLCMSLTPPATITAKLGGGADLELACQTRAFSNLNMHFKVIFNLFHGSETAPQKLVRAGGDQQVYNPLDPDFIQSGGFLSDDIKVNVKGWFGTNMPYAIVHFNPENGGEVSANWVTVNAAGIASVRWKPGLVSGCHKLKARVYDCDGKPMANSPLIFHAYTQGTNDCWNTGLAAEFIEHVATDGTKTIELLVTGGTEPYEWSTDDTNYNILLQTVGFTPQVGHSYTYYVRDAHGCVAEAYYSEPFYDCEESTLGLNVSVVNENTISASAEGGFEPYWYSLDGMNYSTNLGSHLPYYFPNLMDGDYTVYVKDAFGCECTKDIAIDREANVGILIADEGYDEVGNPVGNVQMLASVQAIYDRGICWMVKSDASVLPTVSDFHHSYGSGSEDYNFTLEGLENQYYYVRAYVITDSGTAYSNTIEMTPQHASDKPLLYAIGVNAVMSTSANCSSNVVNDGHSAVTERGFCWSKDNLNPTLTDNHIECGAGTGVFSTRIIGLQPEETYYVRAYATNSVGTSYGFVDHFTTLPQVGDGNLVYNGDFELGNVGFETDYLYLPSMGQYGTYNVHTEGYGQLYGYGGSGMFMVVDGSTVANAVVWRETVEVTPYTIYEFSTQIVSIGNSANFTQAQLQFLVNGAQIGDVFYATSILGLWQEFQASWNSGDATTAELTIIDLNTRGDGNDFGIDDIYFGTATPGGGSGNHDYVDLGLPSGLLWATCNVGADNPEDYGDYFAWGETTTKDIYNWGTYQYCNGSYNTLTKYCNNSSYGYNGFTDNLTTLLPEDDAATANWGSGWRMPTQEEWQELLDNTTSTWTTRNGVTGRLFTASNGNSLFLPAAGYQWDDGLCNAGYCGDFWSSSLYTDDPDYAWYLGFYSGYPHVYYGSRSYGRSVRPVLEH